MEFIFPQKLLTVSLFGTKAVDVICVSSITRRYSLAKRMSTVSMSRTHPWAAGAKVNVIKRPNVAT